MFKENQSTFLHIAVLMAMVFGFTAGFAAATVADDEDKKPAKPVVEKIEKHVESDASDAKEDEEAHELSIAPGEYPIFPEDRPMWVDQPSKIEDGWAEIVVQSIPSISFDKSAKSLAEQQQIAVNAYIDELFLSEDTGESIGMTREEIGAKLVDQMRTYNGKITTSTGEMYQHASVLRLDENFHAEITDRWEEFQIADRLKGMGVLGAGLFVILAGLTGFLRTIAPRNRSNSASNDETVLV